MERISTMKIDVDAKKKKLKKIKRKEGDDELKIGDTPLESNISKTLGDKNTRTVIIIILLTLFILPLMEIVQWVSYKTSMEIGLKHLHKVYSVEGNSADFQTIVQYYIDYHKDLYLPIVYLEVPGRDVWESEKDKYKKLRDSDE